MNLDTFLAAHGTAIDHLALAAGCSAADLAARGASPQAASHIEHLYGVYYTGTSFTGRRRRSITAARTQGHGLFELMLIEDYVAKVGTTKREQRSWLLREELCATPSAKIDKVAKKRLATWRKPRAQPQPKATLTRHANGNATLTITGRDVEFTEVFNSIDQNSPDQSFLDLTRGKGGLSQTHYHAQVVVQLDDFAALHGRAQAAACTAANEGAGATSESTGALGAVRSVHANATDAAGVDAFPGADVGSDTGTGGYVAEGNPSDADVIVRATNGVRMSGAELLQRVFLDRGMIALVSREHGPLDLYRFERFASDKQRALLAAEGPGCNWLHCNVAFDKCQIHHLTPWVAGGQTNIRNLAVLCEYHNGVNEDSPPGGIPQSRGRMVRVKGRVAWQGPGGGPPVPTSPTN
ncbi:HNH endonuclease [Corynebacterium lizhenjunii]|uniref:HNH endonuclease n=1 Tax=Corynebacterium lizhenjunii TaxID=2709394 RepID=A0A7T0KEM3_9CORY|nr:HNH endonuclease signature motif containing protein [Corynebacterium lizhenjunii]QPK78544.1 HNH endonuclease [Corynebacterium lizhenjunii]